MERGRHKKWKDKFGVTAGKKRKEERTHCKGGSDVENMEGGRNEGEKERQGYKGGREHEKKE